MSLISIFQRLQHAYASNKEPPLKMLRFNLMRVEIRELRPEVVAESDKVLVHYRSRTNV